ncbi:MAG: hypothetical protein HC898_12300 [Phycisphaerales bacterium]|nr:hypothetical protein [Phycisphaerales bacterium]
MPDTQPALPGITIHRAPATDPAPGLAPAPGHIDLEAKVVLREGKWLELLACTPGSKEHESILTVTARPSHIHLALLILGMEPGSPMKWDWQGDEFKITPPTGPKIAITLHYTDAQGKAVDVAAHHWIRNQKLDQPLTDNHWLFTGSRTEIVGDQSIYRADVNGSAISLVNFSDDLLARPTHLTHQNDDATWAAQTDAIPPLGTSVNIRLTPVKNP